MVLVTATVCANPNSTSRYNIELPAGVLTKVYIMIPPGHRALTHLRILRGATQIIPHVGTVTGDGETVEWSEYIEIAEKETFTIEVTNTDTVYEHCFYVKFEVQSKLMAAPHLTLLSSLKKLLEAMGIE